jgi:hypothetical protein
MRTSGGQYDCDQYGVKISRRTITDGDREWAVGALGEAAGAAEDVRHRDHGHVQSQSEQLVKALSAQQTAVAVAARVIMIRLPLRRTAQPLYNRFPIIFSGCFSKVVIGYNSSRAPSEACGAVTSSESGACWPPGRRRSCRLPGYPRARARKVLCWPTICRLAHAFLWKYSHKRLKVAQLLGQLGGSAPFSHATRDNKTKTWAELRKRIKKKNWFFIRCFLLCFYIAIFQCFSYRPTV